MFFVRIDPPIGQEKMTKYEQEGLVPFVVDAVYALAHAIHNLLNDRCQEWTRGSKRPFRWSPNESCIQEPIKSRELLNYIRKVRFIGKLLLILTIWNVCVL